MVRHQRKFDGHSGREKLSLMLGDEPPSEIGERVRKDGGKTGEGEKVIPEEFRQLIDRQWQEFVRAKLGFKDIDEVRMEWKKERLDIASSE